MNIAAFDPWAPLIGGIIIGLAAAALTGINGRILGVSGIYSGLLQPKSKTDLPWRAAFIGGMVGGGLLLHIIYPSAFDSLPSTSLWVTAVAGVLVGVGTKIGGGCTSGHGVCGIGRLSVRSILATVIFMLTAILTVLIVRQLSGGVG